MPLHAKHWNFLIWKQQNLHIKEKDQHLAKQVGHPLYYCSARLYYKVFVFLFTLNSTLWLTSWMWLAKWIRTLCPTTGWSISVYLLSALPFIMWGIVWIVLTRSFSWQCQNLCSPSLAFITDWRVVAQLGCDSYKFTWYNLCLDAIAWRGQEEEEPGSFSTEEEQSASGSWRGPDLHPTQLSTAPNPQPLLRKGRLGDTRQSEAGLQSGVWPLSHL